MCNHFSLPGIKAIAYLAAMQLPDNLAMQSLAGLEIGILVDMMNIPFSGEPTCECTQTNAQGGSSEAVELVFLSNTQLPEEFHLAFVVIDANSRYFLIGTKEEHPAIERRQNFGAPQGDPSCYTYTISLTSPRALIPCKMS